MPSSPSPALSLDSVDRGARRARPDLGVVVAVLRGCEPQAWVGAFYAGPAVDDPKFTSRQVQENGLDHRFPGGKEKKGKNETNRRRQRLRRSPQAPPSHSAVAWLAGTDDPKLQHPAVGRKGRLRTIAGLHDYGPDVAAEGKMAIIWERRHENHGRRASSRGSGHWVTPKPRTELATGSSPEAAKYLVRISPPVRIPSGLPSRSRRLEGADIFADFSGLRAPWLSRLRVVRSYPAARRASGGEDVFRSRQNADSSPRGRSRERAGSARPLAPLSMTPSPDAEPRKLSTVVCILSTVDGALASPQRRERVGCAFVGE